MADIKQAIEYAKANPTSPFAKELRRRIETGQMDNELRNAGLKIVVPENNSGFVNAVKDLPSDLVETVKGVGSAIKSAYDTSKEAIAQANAGDISIPAAGLKMVGATGRGLGETVGQAITGAGKVFLSPDSEKAVANKVGEVAGNVMEAQPVQTLIQKYESLSPEQKALIDGTLGIAEGVSTFLAAPASRLVRVGADVAETAAKTAVGGVARATEGVVNVAEKGIEKTVSTAKNLLDTTELSRLPNRVATNIANKKALNATIESLPTQTAKNAVRDGVDIADVRQVDALKTSLDKKVAKELFDTVKKTDAGELVKDPIEVVGKPIVAKINQLDKKAQSVGAKLSKASENLGTVTKPELVQSVFARLSAVPELKGIQLNNGVLNFKNTRLASTFTTADRKAIQQAFTEATRWGNGIKAHKFRQELFDVLDGKKRSLENMTGGQEKGLQAIRQGLADVLDNKNPTYKKLNQEYAKIAQPLTDIRKLIKATGDTTDDILEMNAGLLARRLTSTSLSQGQVKSVLKALDEATAVKGKVSASTEALQDLYNILNKYYRIAPKTGFQGQTKQAIDSSTVSGFIMNKAKNLAGESDAVRQKAIEALLSEILK